LIHKTFKRLAEDETIAARPATAPAE